MAGPWEQYQSAPTTQASAGPWAQYQQGVPAAPAATLIDEDDDRSKFNTRLIREGARQVGRFGKAVAEGALTLPAMAYDAMTGRTIANALLGPATVQRERTVSDLVTGRPAQSMQVMPPSATSELTNMLSSPELAPQNASERMQEDVVRGVSGALTGAGVAGAALRAGATGGLMQTLAANPVQQAVAGGVGSGASGAAREQGASPAMQAAAGLIGGVGGGAVGAVGSRSASAAKALIDPFRQGGRQAIAGRILNEAAGLDAARNIASAADIVPGTQATTAEVAKDSGIAYLQSRLRAIDPSGFARRESTQNEARNVLLDKIADGGTPEAIARRVDAREKLTTPLRNKAFEQAEGKRVPTEKIVSDIDTLLADPENAGQSVQAALKSVRRQIAGEEIAEAGAEGISVTTSNPVTNAKALYAVRKEINRILEGRYVGSDESVLRYAGGQLTKVKDSIDNAITEVAPDWNRYLSVYSRMSKPINRAETIGEIRRRTDLAAPDVETGRDFISQPKWKNVVSKSIPELSKTLAPPQIAKLKTIAADLDRGAAATSASNIRTRGSDTAANLLAQKNMSVANVIGRAFGKDIKDLPPAVSTLLRPFSWVTTLADDQIRGLLVDAMLDPKLAAKLMRQGTPENVKSFAQSIQKNLTRGSTQGALQGAADQGPTPTAPPMAFAVD